MSEKMNCPCCGATSKEAHSPSCALILYLLDSGNLEKNHLSANRLYLHDSGALRWAPQSVTVAKLAEASATLARMSPPASHAEVDVAASDGVKRLDATTLLDVAAGHMRDRAATYDQPGGERSMGRTVEAFNVITGRAGCDELVARALQKLRQLISLMQGDTSTNPHSIEVVQAACLWLDQSMSQGKARTITESEGWLLMQILKDVRDRQREAPHRDSLEDGIAYAALKAEARLAE